MSSRLVTPYLIDEVGLAQKLGHSIPPLRVFTLEGLGIDAQMFLDYIRPTFSVLHLDPYDAMRNKVDFLRKRAPDQANRLTAFLGEYYAGREDLDAVLDIIANLSREDLCEFDRIGLTSRRKRSLARFMIHRTDNEQWDIRRVARRAFVQNVGKDDIRGKLRRVFAEAPEFVTDYPPMLRLIRRLADMVLEFRPEAKTLEMNLHQMFIFADLMSAGDNAPEGIHQDGCDFIVSALVIERAGILGGESIVYGLDKTTEYLRRTLAPGEGIFQADRGSELWHYVTPIKEDPNEAPDYGHRSILGFDFDVVA